MADFNAFWPRILEWEGWGYTNRPHDAGGPTKMGVTQMTLGEYRGRAVSAEDVRALGPDEAQAIYRKLYWVRLGCDRMADQALAELVCDFGIHSGPGRAARYLQKACGVVVDGRVGPRTLAAAAANATGVFSRLKAARRAFLHGIVRAQPSQAGFLRGWLRRVDSFTYPPAAGKADRGV